ncbi:MAG: hypothetical protein BVN35_14460 [Proteobacteria bacterium ST_bin11]|nr:MAG: hypothetical protein BVN35_14460 [Proteobacteria bacterium ST_bin11]
MADTTATISSKTPTFSSSSSISSSTDDEEAFTFFNSDDEEEEDSAGGICTSRYKINNFCSIDVKTELFDDDNDEDDNSSEENSDNDEEVSPSKNLTAVEKKFYRKTKAPGTPAISPFPLATGKNQLVGDSGFDRPVRISDIIDPTKYFCPDEEIGPSLAYILLKSKFPLKTQQEIANDPFATHHDNAQKQLTGATQIYNLASKFAGDLLRAFGEGLDERDCLSQPTFEERLTADYCGSIRTRQRR